MRYNLKLILAASIFLVILIILLAVQGGDPHQFEGKCAGCHVGLKDPSILTKEVDHLCLECHPDNDKRSHPSGIVPVKALPEQFPLVRGKMVCVTCHFSHHPKGETRDKVPGPYLLRASSAGKVFCFQCHRGNFTSEEIDSHAIAFKRAHTKALPYDMRGILDDNSRECLSCHDGTISSGSDYQVKGLNWEHKKNIGMSHPISVDYVEAYNRNPRRLHPPENLDPAIVLINGKIGCESCHNHFSKNKKYLVMDNFRSRLCLSCHNI